MEAQPGPEEADGEAVHRPSCSAAPVADGLYRYVPVPPAYFDADGYLF